MLKKIFSKFTLAELITISLTAGLGIAVKIVLSPLKLVSSGPLDIPGGAVFGGIYMMFIVIPAFLTRKALTGTLTAFVQSVLVVLTGFGSIGAAALPAYILPGVAVDIVLLLSRRRNTLMGCFFACMLANIAGTSAMNLLLFRMPIVPLLFVMSGAALSGGIGGVISYNLVKRLARVHI